MRSKLWLMIVSGLVVGSVGADIVVGDKSFEDDVTTSAIPIKDSTVTAWDTLSTGLYPDIRDENYWAVPPHDGHQVGYLQGTMYQNFSDTYVEGITYSISYWVYRSSGTGTTYAYFTNADGSTDYGGYVLSGDSNHSGAPVIGVWVRRTVTYTAKADDDGGSIGFGIYGSQYIFIDDFSDITVASEPPPSSATWTNAGTGAWETAANWDNGVPYIGTNIKIENGGTAQSTASGNAVRYFTLGSASGDGTLNLSAGDFTADKGTYLAIGGGTGTINVSGGAVYTAEFMGVGLSVGTGTINLSGGATLKNLKNLRIGGTDGGSGFINITGASTTLVAYDGISIGYWSTNAAALSEGTLVIDGGAVIASGDTSLAHHENSVGMVTITNGGSLYAAGLHMAYAGQDATINLDGDLTVPYYAYIGYGHTGTVNQVGGTFSCGYTDSQYAHGAVVGGNTNSVGSYTISGGTLIASTSATNGADAFVVGGWPANGGGADGTFKVVGHGATIMLENYNQFSSGTLVAEIDASGISVINVNGTNDNNGVANLAGTFEVVDSGAPYGTYTILVASNRVAGTFDTFVPPSSDWGIVYGSNTVSVVHALNKIISLKPFASGVAEMVFSCPTPSTSYPLKKTDLVIGTWDYVGYSTNGSAPFDITDDLGQSAVSGSNRVIYLDSTSSSAFFGIGD